MPVASFVTTGTACGRHPVAAGARGGSPPPSPSPARFYRENSTMRKRKGLPCGNRPPEVRMTAPPTEKPAILAGFSVGYRIFQSNFSLKGCAFQTIRPVVRACCLFQRHIKALPGDERHEECSAFPQRRVFQNKARWGKDGGPGGKVYKNAFPRFAAERLGPLAPAEVFSFPPVI